MPDTLPVYLNREELHSVEVPDTFETTGSFDVALVNHGTSVHVHLHLDDALSEIAALDASNHFIDSETQRVVTVEVTGDGEVTGKLKVASAYGAETRYVDVHLAEPEETESAVEVGESLSQPQPQSSETTTDAARSGGAGGAGALVDNPELVVLVLGGLALAAAVVAAVVIEETVVLLGALVVLAGVLGALFVLRSDS